MQISLQKLARLTGRKRTSWTKWNAHSVCGWDTRHEFVYRSHWIFFELIECLVFSQEEEIGRVRKEGSRWVGIFICLRLRYVWAEAKGTTGPHSVEPCQVGWNNLENCTFCYPGQGWYWHQCSRLFQPTWHRARLNTLSDCRLSKKTTLALWK